MKEFLLKNEKLEKMMSHVTEERSECGSSEYKKSEDDETNFIK
jgi:hypothetical protein